MTHWRYVVTKEIMDDEEVWGIRELYYIDGNILWTADLVDPRGESRESVIGTLTNMVTDATHYDYLDMTVDPPQLVTPGGTQ